MLELNLHYFAQNLIYLYAGFFFINVMNKQKQNEFIIKKIINVQIFNLLVYFP